MKLIELIISIFQTRFDDVLFPNFFGNYRKFNSFMLEVAQFCKLIDLNTEAYQKELRYALWASNSSSYIAIFIALILKGVDFYMIPKKMYPSMVSSIIINSDINILFTDSTVDFIKVHNKVVGYPCFKYILNIITKELLLGRKLHFFEEILPSLFHDVPEDTSFQEKLLNEFMDIKTKVHKKLKNPLNSHTREMVVFARNPNSLYPQAFYFDDEEIYTALIKLINNDKFPTLILRKETLYCEFDFAVAPIWGILWPLYEDAEFVFNIAEASVVLTNSHLFETRFGLVSRSVYESKFIGKLLLKSYFTWLSDITIKIHLKKHFNIGTKKKAIIILNAFLAPRIMKSIIDNLPIYTTFGIPQLNHVVAINNFSTKEHKQENCVGELLDGIGASLKESEICAGEGSLVLIADHFANNVTTEKEVYFDTRIHATIIKSDLLFIFGSMQNQINGLHVITKGANYENIERILKNVPYFRDVLLHKDKQSNLHILIYPNEYIVEAGKLGIIDFNNFIKSYKTMLNNVYGLDFIKSVKMLYTDFVRGYFGEINRDLYTVGTITEENIEDYSSQ